MLLRIQRCREQRIIPVRSECSPSAAAFQQISIVMLRPFWLFAEFCLVSHLIDSPQKRDGKSQKQMSCCLNCNLFPCKLSAVIFSVHYSRWLQTDCVLREGAPPSLMHNLCKVFKWVLPKSGLRLKNINNRLDKTQKNKNVGFLLVWLALLFGVEVGCLDLVLMIYHQFALLPADSLTQASSHSDRLNIPAPGNQRRAEQGGP